MTQSSPQANEWRATALLVALGIAMLYVFGHFAVDNYRSNDGVLGANYPGDWQREIVAGDAPAPYVYRQGVPRVREALFAVLMPGHAAVLIDLAFAIVALFAGVLLARFAWGPRKESVGLIFMTLSLAIAYPHDKPEAIATVALASAACAMFAVGRQRLAILVALFSTPFRPELPVLLGFSFFAAVHWGSSTHGTSRLIPHRRALPYLLPVVVAVSYLLACRLLWWPDAVYPEGTAVFMLWLNLTSPMRWPGLLFAVFLLATASRWGWVAWQQRTGTDGTNSVPRLGLALFVACWVTAWLVVGKTDEIRLAGPVLPMVLLLGFSDLSDHRPAGRAR